MFVLAPPPAIEAPARPCSGDETQDVHVGASAVLRSPDCQWLIAYRGGVDAPPSAHLSKQPRQQEAAVANAQTGKTIATFEMSRSATAHWLEDGRNLIVSYHDGSGSERTLAFRLGAAAHKPLNLADLVYKDALKRISKRPEQVYHYYVHYLHDGGDRITIAAEPWYTLHGDEGEGGSSCLIYTVDTATFRNFRFERAIPDQDCPQSPRDYRASP